MSCMMFSSRKCTNLVNSAAPGNGRVMDEIFEEEILFLNNLHVEWKWFELSHLV